MAERAMLLPPTAAAFVVKNDLKNSSEKSSENRSQARCIYHVLEVLRCPYETPR